MKNNLRKHFKAVRNNLSEKEVISNSADICHKITSHPHWQKAKVIMCYLAFGNEVNTKSIIAKAWQENKQVIIPVCDTQTIAIIPSLLHSFEDLEPRTMGILEPKEGKLHPVDPKIIDLVLIPGVAFDLSGHRLGFGAGYYDRFLPQLKPSTPKIALAHQVQISNTALPHDHYDVPMDYICTEKNFFNVINGKTI